MMISSPSNPAITVRPLVALLNHGLLPFVGRRDVLEQTCAFCETTAAGDDLGVMVVSGEAGIGKTRIALALTERLREQGRRVLRLKFYPDASPDLIRLCALALDADAETNATTKGYTGTNRRDTVEELRYRCQRSPIVLLIEDLHLLGAGSTQSISEFLHTLSDLPLPVVVLTRPLTPGLLGVLEAYRRLSIQLSGVGIDDVAELWHILFEEPPDAGVIDAVVAATHGNPLALRSGFRMVAEEIAHRDTCPVSRTQSLRHFRHGARLIAQGLIAHLSQQDRDAASLLAPLGEVFDRRLAEAVLAGRSQAIDKLCFNGILHPLPFSSAAPMLGEPSGAPPLAFSHTLIHQLLLAEGQSEPTLMLVAIASGIPIYSTLPIMLMPVAVAHQVAPADLHRYLRGAIGVAYDRVQHGDVDCGAELCNRVAAMLCDTDRLEQIQRLDVELNLRRFDLNLMVKSCATEHWCREVDRALADTEDLPIPMLRHRIGLLRSRQMLDYNLPLQSAIDQGVLWSAWHEVAALVEQHPELRSTGDHARFLGTAAQVAVFVADTEMIVRVQSEVKRTLACKELNAGARRNLLCGAVVRLVACRQAQENPTQAIAQLEVIEAEYHDVRTTFQRLKLHAEIGNVATVCRLAEQMRSVALRQGLWGIAYHCDLVLLLSSEQAVCDVDHLIDMVRSLHQAYSARLDSRYDQQVNDDILLIALTHGRSDLLLRYAPVASAEQQSSSPELALAVALCANDHSAMAATSTRIDFSSPLRSLTSLLLSQPFSLEDRERTVRSLTQPVIRYSDLVTLWVTVLLFERIEQKPPLVPIDDIRNALVDYIGRVFNWLVATGQVTLLEPIFLRSEQWLSNENVEGWQSALRDFAIAKNVSDAKKPRRDVTVIGEFSLMERDERRIALRGRRMQAMLAALVADRLLPGSLSRREIVELATGEPYSLQARKSFNTSVRRLRETLGGDSLPSDAEGLPRLNMDVVDVDILRLHSLHAQSAVAMHERDYAVAADHIEAALSVAARGVAFPGLYDTTYDRLRDTIESGCHDLTLRVTNALLDANAVERALDVATQGVLAMPGDEELEDMYREVRMRNMMQSSIASSID